ncbi:competence protein CoiA [Halobacillus litoralis]|uniref:competence protein CoiA n=1 Tax=Halobacillus litoralis TaxID=45668 RepID=UPI001CD1F1CD|nr:competence protein CoiA family protein [Halobacillus litoralis]MCA0969581.1 competence protein CoiA [Halobacillus litoralis]
MFYAQNESGELQALFSKNKEELEQCRTSAYFCPICEEKVHIRFGPKVTPHFAHASNSLCAGMESEQHEKGKWYLYNWLRSQGYQAELEHFIPIVNQRPDVFLEVQHRKIAIEFQCARISERDIVKRTLTYQQKGITPFWVIGSNHLKRKGNTLAVNSFLKSFLYYFHGQYLLYFLNVHNRNLHIAHDLRSVTDQKWLSTVATKPLDHFSLPQLFSKKNTPFRYVENPFWEKLLYSLRTRYQQWVGSEEAQFRQYLYLNNLHFSLIPSIAYLPLSGQITLKTKPFIWQTRFLMKYFLYVPVGGHVQPSPLEGQRTVNGHHPDLSLEYLCMLEELGYVKQSGDEWIKTKDVTFYKTVEDALRGDKKLIQTLKNLHRI